MVTVEDEIIGEDVLPLIVGVIVLVDVSLHMGVGPFYSGGLAVGIVVV